MNVRDLNRLVTIRSRAKVDDGFADIDAAPVDAFQRWAKKTDVSDAERVAAAAQGQTISTRFLLRYDARTAAIAPSWQVVCDGLVYEVRGRKEVGYRLGVELSTTALL